jgi:hypothetical protein
MSSLEAPFDRGPQQALGHQLSNQALAACPHSRMDREVSGNDFVYGSHGRPCEHQLVRLQKCLERLRRTARQPLHGVGERLRFSGHVRVNSRRTILSLELCEDLARERRTEVGRDGKTAGEHHFLPFARFLD